jgi:hypothetical protein
MQQNRAQQTFKEKNNLDRFFFLLLLVVDNRSTQDKKHMHTQAAGLAGWAVPTLINMFRRPSDICS